ncbi:hypothetical protein [Paenibacillus koleovorans]|uniref:hypothetical protein n=1 Tax=Paenibacillus koleovorans TaxID=121608 RepID=UPI000FD8626A|nr:hypothetical protein [Paenibacillus koleovorans]
MYLRLVVLVLAFEVLVTVAVGIGIYQGFAIFPYSLANPVEAVTQTNSFTAVIPMYLPELPDLKIPFTSLKTNSQHGGPLSIFVSTVILIVQAFVRGMYLGGIHGWLQGKLPLSLIVEGRRYFYRMFGWSFLQAILGGLLLVLAMTAIPLGILILLILLLFSLAPYLVVIRNYSLGYALGKAPGMLGRRFFALLPIAVVALLGTLFIGLFRALPAPYGYAVPLLSYAFVGTGLIALVMKSLSSKPTAAETETRTVVVQNPQLEAPKPRSPRKLTLLLPLALIPLLTAAAFWAASGSYLRLLDWGTKEQLAGISYKPSLSDVYYASQGRYATYEWLEGDFRIAIDLPDLSNDKKPRELNGVAEITWLVDEEEVSETRTPGRITNRVDVVPLTRTSHVMYRLVQTRGPDGSLYYTSAGGAANLLPGDEKPHQPFEVQTAPSRA